MLLSTTFLDFFIRRSVVLPLIVDIHHGFEVGKAYVLLSLLLLQQFEIEVNIDDDPLLLFDIFATLRLYLLQSLLLLLVKIHLEQVVLF